MSTSTSETAQLFHALNQRYRREWDRAERLQAQLDDIHASRAWRLFALGRRFARWLRKSNPPTPALPPTPYMSEVPDVAAGTVSAIIPFKDRGRLLGDLLESMAATTYRAYEIVLVDHESTCPETLDLVRRLVNEGRVRAVRSTGPFNYSRLCNLGAQSSTADFLLFLNNDMLVQSPDWLDRLLQPAGIPDVGIVGATLLYPDMTVQHAGIFPNDSGGWTHRHRGVAIAEANDELRHVRLVPAVTGACLLARRALFEELGGFREAFAVTGNDVDLCQRARAAGKSVALTPHAQLIHYESMSRGYSRD